MHPSKSKRRLLFGWPELVVLGLVVLGAGVLVLFGRLFPAWASWSLEGTLLLGLILGLRRFIVWHEALALGLVVVGVGLLGVFVRFLPGWLSWSLIGILSLGLVLALRRLWRPLFGPVLFYDLIRSTRRGRYAALRCLYAAALLLILFLFYAKWSNGLWEVWLISTVHPTDASRFAAEFFYAFITVQFLAVVFLTPAFTAGAIAEEKERRTFEYLFTTDLGNGEIVIGKLVSRLAFMALLILTGLPLLSLLQFLGGVDPGLVLAGFAATALTMLSIASLSLLNSAYVRKPLTAIFLTYLELIVYFAASFYLGDGLSCIPPGKWGPEHYLLAWFCSGNAWVVLNQLTLILSATGSFTTALPQLVRAYALFHVPLALLSLVGATLPLRLWMRSQLSARGQRSFVLAITQKRLPRVTDQPMIWKEVFAEPTFRFNRTGMVVTATFVSISLILCTFVLICLFSFGWSTGTMNLYMNSGARSLGTFIACLLLMGVAVRAAGSLSGERDRDTLVSLLSTPLEDGEILWGKWLGSVLCGRKLWWYLGGIWVAALLTGGLHPVALVLMVTAWTVFVMFLASIGLWFSLVSRNSLRATIWTVLTLLGACVVPWLLRFLCHFVAALFPSSRLSPFGRPGATNPVAASLYWLADVLSSLAPPSTLYSLAFYDGELNPTQAQIYTQGYGYGYGYGYKDQPPDLWMKLLTIVLGLMVYAVAALIFWRLTRARFAETVGRLPLPQSGRPRRARSTA